VDTYAIPPAKPAQLWGAAGWGKTRRATIPSRKAGRKFANRIVAFASVPTFCHCLSVPTFRHCLSVPTFHHCLSTSPVRWATELAHLE